MILILASITHKIMIKRENLLRAIAFHCVLGTLPASGAVQSFGSVEISFVEIGNPGNAPDDVQNGRRAFGQVDYAYQISTHEISRGMINAYNGSGNSNISLSDMSSYGGNGLDQPATGVSWNEAARFVNWLNAAQGYPPAYNFSVLAGGNDNIALWTGLDAGYNSENPFRNSNAHYFLPSEDEWYKAAYFDGAGGVYNDYSTGSDTPPIPTGSGIAPETAVYSQSLSDGPAPTILAGGLSPYGTMGQGGNVWEWTESAHDGQNNSPTEIRGQRGGAWVGGETSGLQWSGSNGVTPSDEFFSVGFRVAAIPEPSPILLFAPVLLVFACKRVRL